MFGVYKQASNQRSFKTKRLTFRVVAMLKKNLNMKTGFWILTVLAVASADKPGICPGNSTDIVISQQECVSDFDCMGTDKCCGSLCTQPECELVPADCEINPCALASCANVPEAMCYQDPCSDTCDVIWLTEERDVTGECVDVEIDYDDEVDFDDDDDDEFDDEELDEDEDVDEKTMSWKERKARRKARKQAFLQKLTAKREKKMQAIENRRAAKIEKWTNKGKEEKVQRFQEKWANKDATLEERLEAQRAKKLARKQERQQARKEWRQRKQEMSPEELEAYKVEKKANKMEKQQRKEEKKEQRKEMKKQQKTNKRKVNKKLANKWRARKERKERRKTITQAL